MEPKNPASTNRLTEEVGERENLKEALQQLKANKGSPGVDGITVGRISPSSAARRRRGVAGVGG